MSGKGGFINLLNSATAGVAAALTALGSASDGAFGGSEIPFHDSAGTATIIAEGARGRDDADGGNVIFYIDATAANEPKQRSEIGKRKLERSRKERDED